MVNIVWAFVKSCFGRIGCLRMEDIKSCYWFVLTFFLGQCILRMKSNGNTKDVKNEK